MKKRILACLLALVMLIGILPVTAMASNEEVPTVPMLDVSKSKTATALDANGQTQITLSLPSAEMKKTLDVVFVVDNAFPKDNVDAASKAADLVDDLLDMSQKGNLNINIGLVISGGYVPVLSKHELEDIETAADAIKTDVANQEWKNIEGRKGSNIQAGIETGLAMLEKENQADKENKYLILISDGGAFAWNKNDTAYSKFYQNKASNGTFYYWCNPYDFDLRYDQDGTGETFDFSALMQMDENDVDANSLSVENAWGSNANTQYAKGYLEGETKGVSTTFANVLASSETVHDKSNAYITSREAALFHAAKSIKKASEAANVIFVSFPYNPKMPNLFTFTEGFKDYVAQYENVKLYRVHGNGEANRYPAGYTITEKDEVFNSVQTDLVQLVATGSRVEDTIGSNFELVSIDSLTVDGQPLTCDKNGNTYTGAAEIHPQADEPQERSRYQRRKRPQR